MSWTLNVNLHVQNVLILAKMPSHGLKSAVTSFIQFLLNGNLVFPEQVAVTHVLLASSDWYKCVQARGARPALSDPKTRRPARPGSFYRFLASFLPRAGIM